MKQRFMIGCSLVALLSSLGFSQVLCPPQLRDQRVFGSTGYEDVFDLYLTPDGGMVLGGTSGYVNGPGGNKTSPDYGGGDYWLVRLDAAGNQLWDQSYGCNGFDRLTSVRPTGDGGYVLGGSSWGSANGNKTSPSLGSSDYWVVRTDAQGNKLWDKSYGGGNHEDSMVLATTADGGFILGGPSWSEANGNKTTPNFGLDDFWVVRTDGDGNILWQRSFGGRSYDELSALQQTADGGYILGGSSSSEITGNKTSPNYGSFDYWVVRLDAAGNKLWDRSFGGNSNDQLRSLLQMPDGGFILCGLSGSPADGNKTSSNYGGIDGWIVRLDANGNKVWERTYGGETFDGFDDLSPTADGGFLLSGWSQSLAGGSKLSTNYGGSDYWVVRIDSDGMQIWDESFGGFGEDQARAGARLPDGGYIVAGFSDSQPSGSKTSESFGGSDIWLLKLFPENPTDCDNDGVPNAGDRCPQTTPGSIVNSEGCAIAQLCPCAAAETHHDYVTCVRQATTGFQQTGLISSAQRREIVDEALAANCPPRLELQAEIIFGLTHRALGGGILETDSEYYRGLLVHNPQNGNSYGVSVSLGEADSGIFIYPDGEWGNFNTEWFLSGAAYGRLNGRDQGLISTLRVTKPYYEVYPVEIDLSGLKPESLTFLLFSDRTLVAESTVPGASSSFTVYTQPHLAPRGNPFWRMSDGSVGALIEFTVDYLADGTSPYPSFSLSGPWGEEVRANRIFVRANNPAQRVDYINQVDITASPELGSIQVVEERLGALNHANRALGPVVMEAADGRLNITALETLHYERPGGVLVQAAESSRLEIDLLPLELEEQGASLTILGNGFLVGQPSGESATLTFAQMSLYRAASHLDFQCDFLGLFPNEPFESPRMAITAFRNGAVSGSVVVSNNAIAGVLSRQNNHLPELTACSAVVESNGVPSFAVAFKNTVTLTAGADVELAGNHFRFTQMDSPESLRSISHLALLMTDHSTFTITGERSRILPPTLAISAAALDGIALSWPDNTRLYTLEAASELAGPYTLVGGEVEFIDNLNRLSISQGQLGQRFFRLRLP